jgi:hypothetical protein
MSRDIMRDQGLMLLLAGMKADARLSAFLIGLSQRFANLGYSAMRFRLRMTREEIGSYLGLKLETVSRAFSRFQDDGILSVRQRQIEVLDPDALQRLVTAFGVPALGVEVVWDAALVPAVPPVPMRKKAGACANAPRDANAKLLAPAKASAERRVIKLFMGVSSGFLREIAVKRLWPENAPKIKRSLA